MEPFIIRVLLDKGVDGNFNTITVFDFGGAEFSALHQVFLNQLTGTTDRLANMEIPMATASQDAVALLKADHRKVEDLFEKFESARGTERKKALAEQICTELTVHTIIEEEIFYPACSGQIEDEKLLQEAFVEHDGAKVLIAQIEIANPDDEFYDAKVKVLSEQIKHHVHEEEKRSEGLFAEAKAAGLDVDALGQQMAARKKELLTKFKTDGLPKPQAHTFKSGNKGILSSLGLS